MLYYLINNNSDIPLGKQITKGHSYWDIRLAKKIADIFKEETGDNWEVLEIRTVYTTKTFDKAHRAALDVPHMARD